MARDQRTLAEAWTARAVVASTEAAEPGVGRDRVGSLDITVLSVGNF